MLIPARDEAQGIGHCVEAVLASGGVELEVIVMDDQSQDATAEIVRALECCDARVHLVSGVPLPPGWNGKQHACWRLASGARHPWLVFLDADVRLQPAALVDMLTYAEQRSVDLLSAFPRQETGTLLEKMLIPLMHIVLLCYLPMRGMRSSTSPAFAAGCGQLFVTTHVAYQRAGTHAALRASRHDGIRLPRAYREAGLTTDIVDGTEIASCRMYRSAGEVFRGLLKNADEGIANARLILPFTILLLGGTVAPLALLVVTARMDSDFARLAFAIAAAATAIGWYPRLANVTWLQQSITGALLHPLAIVVFIGIQWTAFGMSWFGKRVSWRGR